MNKTFYGLFRELINEVEQYGKEKSGQPEDLASFTFWLHKKVLSTREAAAYGEPDWEGKLNGRSPESVINTLIVQLYRYAKVYAKLAIADSRLSTIDDFIYLINLKFSGDMTKTALIEKNIQEKSTGMQIINRLLKKGLVVQKAGRNDKRSKVLSITAEGDKTLTGSMENIRKASAIVTGDLDRSEKMRLIEYLQKLEKFHADIFAEHKVIELDQVSARRNGGQGA